MHFNFLHSASFTYFTPSSFSIKTKSSWSISSLECLLSFGKNFSNMSKYSGISSNIRVWGSSDRRLINNNYFVEIIGSNNFLNSTNSV